MQDLILREIREADRFEIAELIYASINVWYQQRGMPAIFRGGPEVTEVFCDVYGSLEGSTAVVAENPRTGRILGGCFYHARAKHVSLGIMTVHPNHFGAGVGGKLVRHIVNFTEAGGFPALRLTQSALNLDSFSLYNRAGFVPRAAYQDMFLPVPPEGLPFSTEGDAFVRPATLDDIPAIAALEDEISGITREQDYRHCIENRLGFWNALVYENARGGLDGVLFSSGHAAVNLLGPGVSRSDEAAAALILRSLNAYPGRTPVFLIPVERDRLVQRMYSWGARNCELHFCQVRGEFRPFAGVNMPSFLPETG